MLVAEALRFEQVKVGVSDLVRDQRVGVLETVVKRFITVAVRSGKIAIIFQSVELLSGGDRDRTQIVGPTAHVRQVEESDVVLTFGLVAIATPNRSWVDCFDALFELVEQTADRGPRRNPAWSGPFPR